MDYVTRFRKFEKRIRDQEITLPAKVLGWLLLRRSGISADHRALILSQVGKEITLDKVEEQLKLCFGMDCLPDARPRGHANLVDDGFFQDDGYFHAYEDYEYDDNYYGSDHTSPPPPHQPDNNGTDTQMEPQ